MPAPAPPSLMLRFHVGADPPVAPGVRFGECASSCMGEKVMAGGIRAGKSPSR